jgi:hypothetical protein
LSLSSKADSEDDEDVTEDGEDAGDEVCRVLDFGAASVGAAATDFDLECFC